VSRPAQTFTLWLILVLAIAASAVSVAQQQWPEIADIVVEGGVTVTQDTVSYYLGLEPGDPLNPKEVADGFHRLWDSGLFEKLRLEKETLPDGRVKLYVIVKERPFVKSVVFKGTHKITTDSLKDKLDEKGIEIPHNVPLKLGDLARIQSGIEEVYAEEGYRSARVTYHIEDLSKTEKKVIFNIEEGGRVKIARIDFVGNHEFSDRRLRRALKKIKQKGIFHLIGKKLLYTKEKWEEDKDNLKKFYMNHGFKDVKIGDPQIKLVAKHPKAKTLKKKKFRLIITIPVEEGKQYTLGDLKIKGAKVLSAEKLRRLFDVRPGKVYRFKDIDKGMESIRKIYQNQGYIYAYTNQVLENRKGADHVVDVTVDIFEGDRYRLGRLEFAGNTTTRDKVLRRQFAMAESEWMNIGALKTSVYKVNALGFWKLDDDPYKFQFDEQKKRVNVTVKGHEVGRNDIQFGMGYSELDGFFVQTLFNTRNFLGKGESLGVSLQTGGRSDYYTLSFTEPYFMDRRILLGGSIFKTNLDIADFNQENKGGTFTVGFGLGIFDSISVMLSYNDVYSRFAVSRGGAPGSPTSGHKRPVDFPPTQFRFFESATEVFQGKTVSLIPAYNYDSRDDPFDPNRGRKFNARLVLSGGFLGGDFDYVRPEVQFSLFHPLSKRTVAAFNIEGGQFFTYSGSDIPIYERYRLGGDRSLRGIPYYTVLPRDEQGNYFLTPGGARLGGDRYWLVNLEYQIRLGGPVKLVLFSDLGNTYVKQQGWDFGNFRKTAGIEFRIFLPVFQAPIRFIYGINLDPYPDEKSSDFQFSFGTTF